MSQGLWTTKQFRRDFPGLEPGARRPLMHICNTAIKNGLTRSEVIDTAAELAQRFPEQMPPSVFIDALQEKIIEKQQSEEAASTPTVKSVYDTYATVADVRDAFKTVSAPADRTEGKD